MGNEICDNWLVTQIPYQIFWILS